MIGDFFKDQVSHWDLINGIELHNNSKDFESNLDYIFWSQNADVVSTLLDSYVIYFSTKICEEKIE